jgi:micrococcal nuclease
LPRHWPRLGLPVLAMLVTGCGGSGVVHSHAPRRSHWGTVESATVDRVVDGDTLDVRLHGRFVRVRTVQIDAPESSSTRYGHPDRCGAAARRFAQTLTHPGALVTLRLGGTSRADVYGRLLALVHLGGAHAITWQQRMVRAGWAEVLVYEGNTTPLLTALRRDAAYAKVRDLGVWAACHGHFHDSSDAR